CGLYHEGLARHAAPLYATTAGTALAHFLSFLLPTTLMGMSLPLLVRATVKETASASRVIAGLYGWNVLGAAAGALAAPWLRVRFLGMEGAVRVGAVGSLVAAAAALLVGQRAARPATADPEPEPHSPGAAKQPLRLWLLLYGLSGFIALSLEIAWFRLMD